MSYRGETVYRGTATGCLADRVVVTEKVALVIRGTVLGLDEDGFRAAAEDAKTNCPVSKALGGVPEITLDASLA